MRMKISIWPLVHPYQSLIHTHTHSLSLSLSLPLSLSNTDTIIHANKQVHNLVLQAYNTCTRRGKQDKLSTSYGLMPPQTCYLQGHVTSKDMLPQSIASRANALLPLVSTRRWTNKSQTRESTKEIFNKRVCVDISMYTKTPGRRL